MATEGTSTIDPTPDRAFALENKRMDLDAGMLGRFFGTGAAASTSIAGLVVVMLSGAGIVLTFFETKMPAADYWKVTGPIITLALGYLFGRKS